MNPYTVIFDGETLQRRIEELGKEIDARYHAELLVLVSMLKGSLYFLADLSRAIATKSEYDMVAVSSEGTRMRLTRDITVDVRNKHVLVVEEIVRTGLTTNFLLQHLEAKQPKSMAVCALLHNPQQQLIELPLTHVGFVIDETRVIGYGMDYREQDRTLPFIARLEKDRYRTQQQRP